MVPKAASVASKVLLAAAIAFFPLLSAGQQPNEQTAFTVRDASRLVNQLADALEGHQLNKFLSAFDLSRMENGQLFKQQIASFFAHADSINVHINVTEAAMNGDKGTVAVEAEIETGTRNDNVPPVRKHATLHFTAERSSSSGWKFTDLQPRAFFSAAPNPNATTPK
jgi:hypothetical protein